MNKLLSIEAKLGFVNRPFSIDFPNGSPEQGGTCEFMTEQCKKFCSDLYKYELFESNTYAFFKNSSITEICQELVKHRIESPLMWFCDSGDCPMSMMGKLLKVIRFLSDNGVAQGGFTRNKSFWVEANKIEKVRFFLTVEDMGSVQEMNKLGPVAYPLYGTEQVRIYTENAIWLCGLGDLIFFPICGLGELQIGDVKHPEDCSNCYKEKIGCFV